MLGSPPSSRAVPADEDATIDDGTFFFATFGVREAVYEATHAMLLQHLATPRIDVVSGKTLQSFNTKHGGTVQSGCFETPSVAELRAAVHEAVATLDKMPTGRVTVRNIVGESNSMHFEPEYEGAVVQAASQFNCLEMASPHVTPERGITCYEHDRTQGPACATACGAGTAWRNYMHRMPDGAVGQTKDNQVNTLADIEAYAQEQLTMPKLPWRVKNGYIEASEQMAEVNTRLFGDPTHVDAFHSMLRIGVQWDTQVMSSAHTCGTPVTVTQTYNSAVSIGYSRLPTHLWSPMARAVLDATYEATLLVGVLHNVHRVKRGLPTRPVLLTKVGGGVFRNDARWIQAAIVQGCAAVAAHNFPLDVRVVHYGSVESGYDALGKA